MKVLLCHDHETLGSRGDVVDVKPGYARNFLMPRNIALPMTKGNLKVLEEEQKQVAMQGKREEIEADKIKESLEKISVTATVTVGEDDRIFGTVTSQNITDLLKEKGFAIDKKTISIDEPVKALGIYPVTIQLHQEVSAKIKLWVVKG